MRVLFSIISLCIIAISSQAQSAPWQHGKLEVSSNQRYLQHSDGTPFFWLGDTGWLMPERLNRDEVSYYLGKCKDAGYNVVQVQTINGVPAYNIYGESSMEEGYWQHMDYIIKTAEQNGIYIGMVCIWGGLVKSGLLDTKQAQKYGEFLANRYKDSPNIVWIIGGDIKGDVKPEVWESLAKNIRKIDKGHLMTFHPFGRTCSATWWNDAEWLDFNMFQSGHRRYGQQKGDGDGTLNQHFEEDNWRYVAHSQSFSPLKPVLDAEPSYEGIPQGLHDPQEARWTASDVRRYAYWSVFAGSCGHTYGSNSIMQFYRPGLSPAYGADQNWWEALENDGFNQMKYLKELILKFPYFERINDQSIILEGTNGERYDYAVATRGEDYLLIYNYSGRPMRIDLSKISGEKKKIWWFNPSNGQYSYAGEVDNSTSFFYCDIPYGRGEDRVLIAVDATKNYID